MTIIWFWLGLRVLIAVAGTERGTHKCVDKNYTDRKFASVGHLWWVNSSLCSCQYAMQFIYWICTRLTVLINSSLETTLISTRRRRRRGKGLALGSFEQSNKRFRTPETSVSNRWHGSASQKTVIFICLVIYSQFTFRILKDVMVET